MLLELELLDAEGRIVDSGIAIAGGRDVAPGHLLFAVSSQIRSGVGNNSIASLAQSIAMVI